MPNNRFQGRLLDHVKALPPGWRRALESERVSRAVRDIDQFLQQRLEAGATIFPAQPFRMLGEVAAEDVKVVLIGQDPYHGPGQAQGLAFSVPDDCRTPPSLRNMFAELAREYPGEYRPQRNSLVRWATQGVLLMNTALTVEAHKAGSHSRCGWSVVTDAILSLVLSQPRPKVLLLWGAHAQERRVLLQGSPPAGPVHVLMSNHPSPLSASRPPRPFVGCGHFFETNRWLEEHGETGIDWLNNDLPAGTRAEPGSVSDEVAGKRQGVLW
ncbi:MAG TPA: uracil-DNA glycosylase [Pusillimonas sp.]|uniref:uracil-DNA glycosylase n=1 Tax=unclassified Pusillimonas TaxID=2640016 RepID=UPI00261F8127|nr:MULTISPECIES: uracil-DNA glycosylase [unclassified Pusillimonas]HLU20663.1 uracil-DNA glycosylase [Pusillimonas sp.]